MKLYGYWRSSSAWRVRIGLAWKRIEHERIAVDLVRGGGEQHGSSYQAVNPLAQVPTLELDDGRRLTQSLAILEYLEETFPDPPLLPDDPFLRARARQLAEIVNSGIQPFQNRGVLEKVKHELGGDAQAWAHHFVSRGLAALDRTAEPTAGRYLVGDAVSLADVLLVPQLYGARRFGVDLSAFPRLTRVEERCSELPAFADAHPDAQPDAEPR